MQKSFTIKMFSVFIFVALFYGSRSFNTDVNIPVLRQGDQPGSYFGFTVAQYQFNDADSGEERSWLLVGAPKANSSKLLKANDLSLVNPGAIYKCNLKLRGCEQLDFIQKGNKKNSRGQNIEEKSNQWLGVSLSSSGVGGTVLACAHRYIYKTSLVNYHMYPGLCYISSYDLSFNRFTKTDTQCLKRNIADATGSTVATYTRYQFCQMGVSAVYVPGVTGAPRTGKAIFGAPGSFAYQGIIFNGQSEIQYKSDQIGYQGYSTSYGSFFSKLGEGDVVTGAPRHNHHGMVVVFKRDDYKTYKVILPPKVDGQRQPGSGFGSSVVGVDVNNDGWTDILVGAPYYSLKDSVNEGRVFVYMNKGNGEFEKELEIQPSVTKNMAQFGHVVARVGDLDQDGYEDVAIGAPYEDKSGVVYVFNGSAKGLSKTPAQVIKPSDFSQKLSTFGYSIAGRLDMDSNGYPDIMVGAYESDSIVLLRSRPIIEMQSDVTITPNPFDIRSKTCDVKYKGKTIKTACMSMKICLSYKERKGKLKDNLSVDLKIESDVDYKKGTASRILFNATNGPVYNKSLNNLPLYPTTTCFMAYVFLRDNVEDIYPDIKFRVNYKMHSPQTPPTAAPGKLQSLEGYAMLEEHNKTYSSAVLQFKRDCVKCEPNLILKEPVHPKTLAVGEQGYQMEVTVTNAGESAYNSVLFVTVPEGVSLGSVLDATDKDKIPFSISHRVTSEIVGVDNDTVLQVPIANPLKNSKTKIFIVRLSTGSFSKSQDFLPIELEVNSSNPEPPKDKYNNKYNLNVTIESKADLELSGSKRQEQILYGGKVLGESAMKYEEQVGNEVIHTYIVQNLGPDRIPKAEIVIEWPYEAESGKHLLYLMEVIVSGGGICHFLPDQVNLLDLKMKAKSQQFTQNITSRNTESSQDSLVRNRRALESEELHVKESKEKRQTASTIKDKRSTIELDCKTNTARCTPIRCTMNTLTKGDQVSFVVRSRIWNGTLLEDYYGKEVDVVSRASVRSLVSFVKEVNAKNNVAEIRTQFNPDFKPPPSKKLAAWVIPVAVVGAILALALIILILWKIGFFKRKKFDGNITDAEREEMMAESKKEKQPFET